MNCAITNGLLAMAKANKKKSETIDIPLLSKLKRKILDSKRSEEINWE